MNGQKVKSVLIFGGSGFIGSHLVQSFLKEEISVTIADREVPTNSRDIRFIEQDVREPITISPSLKFDLVVVLAAVHRTPGHSPGEYYETNVLGASNIVEWCHLAQVMNIWFLSSISVYGTTANRISESQELLPISDYGKSKIIAERIFIQWLTTNTQNKRLIICRPSVVFGKGENGNMTRLARGIHNGFFFLPTKKPIVKSATYVKEIYPSLKYTFDLGKQLVVFNLSFEKECSLQDYAKTICKIGNFRIPRTLSLDFLTRFEFLFSKLMGDFYKRFLKLFNSTNVEPLLLLKSGYVFKYTLIEAFQDWWEDSKFDSTQTNPDR